MLAPFLLDNIALYVLSTFFETSAHLLRNSFEPTIWHLVANYLNKNDAQLQDKNNLDNKWLNQINRKREGKRNTMGAFGEASATTIGVSSEPSSGMTFDRFSL
jgi:hypothetical protein